MIQKYKCISFSTTIRNPGRYTRFLKIFSESNNKILDNQEKIKIQKKLLKKLIYRPNNGPDWYKQKIREDKELNINETEKIFKLKERKFNWIQRFEQNYKTLKFLGLVQIKNQKLLLTTNGKQLLNKSNPNKESLLNVYSDYLDRDVMTNILLRIQTNSPIRIKVKNKVNPFPFLINLINEINLSEKTKGITKAEFQFSLFSINNDYKWMAKKIIEIRKEKDKKNRIFKNFLNIHPLNLYEKNKNFLKTLNDYSDANIRMYKATGLLKIKGNLDFIDLNYSEEKRINKIFKDKTLLINKIFINENEYIDFLNQNNFFEYKNIVNVNSPFTLITKIFEKKSLYIRDSERKNEKLANFIKERQIKLKDCVIDLETLLKKSSANYKIKELKFLQKPLIFEFLVSLILFLIYSPQYKIIPNLYFDDYNLPTHFATGNRGDIICLSEEKNFLLEVTLIKNIKQQINSETTTITRHLEEIIKKFSKKFQCIFLAPIIHYDTKQWFNFKNKKENLFLPISIEKFIKIKYNLFPKYDKYLNDFREEMKN